MSATRICKTCGNSERYTGDGKCKYCVQKRNAEYQAKNPDKLAAYRARQDKKEKAAKFAAWAKANSERLAASRRAWRAANKGIVKAGKAKWNAANKDRNTATKAAYRLANRERVAANQAAWHAAHPYARRVHQSKRRARKADAGGSLSVGLSAKLFELQRGKCACCGKLLGAGYHLDHRTPLALGGQNIDGNMQLLRSICNLQKGMRHPVEFMQSRGLLL